jgi:uncharacterized protein YbjT (DUF2867 family)
MSNLVLVCGATGQVGSAAARTLKRGAIPVRAFVRQGTDASALTEAGIDVARSDLTAFLGGADFKREPVWVP